MRLDRLDIPWGTGPFARTKRISFELSNRCNMAAAHAHCPLHQEQKTQVLPQSIFESVLRTCQEHDFRGVIAFHLYNEPLIDPRLVLFMERAKQLLPKCRLFLLTNGWYLDEGLARELVEHGLDYLGISAYSEKDCRKWRRLNIGIPVRVLRSYLDDRLEWYNRAPAGGPSHPCYCPLYEVCITCTGKVGLCPYDWKRRHVFGDLRNEPLDAILAHPAVWRAYESLSQGRRRFNLCRNCRTFRGEEFPGPNRETES